MLFVLVVIVLYVTSLDSFLIFCACKKVNFPVGFTVSSHALLSIPLMVLLMLIVIKNYFTWTHSSITSFMSVQNYQRILRFKEHLQFQNIWQMFIFLASVSVLVSCVWILTTPGPAPSQKPSHRPGRGWPPGGWLWPTRALRFHGWSPSGSLGLFVSSSWTLRRTRGLCIFPHIFWPQQTSPWKTRRHQ